MQHENPIQSSVSMNPYGAHTSPILLKYTKYDPYDPLGCPYVYPKYNPKYFMVQNLIIIPCFRGKTRGYATWKSHSILGIWWIIQFQVILVILNWNQWFNPFNIFSIKKSFFNIIVLDVLLFVLKTNKYMILYDFSTKKNCWLVDLKLYHKVWPKKLNKC